MYKIIAILFIGILNVNSVHAIDPGRIFHLYEIGTIKEISLISTDLGLENKDYLTLDVSSSFADEGMSCKLFQNKTVFRLRDDANGRRMLSAAIMAKSSNLPVYAAASYQKLDNEGYCYLTLLVINPGQGFDEVNRAVSGANLPTYDSVFKNDP